MLSRSACVSSWNDSLGMKTTATMMFGHVETLEERIDHLLHLRDLQDRTGGFTAFIGWTFQPENTALAGDELTSFQYLRTLAVARIEYPDLAHPVGGLFGGRFAQGAHDALPSLPACSSSSAPTKACSPVATRASGDSGIASHNYLDDGSDFPPFVVGLSAGDPLSRNEF